MGVMEPHQIYLAGGAGVVSYEHRRGNIILADEGNDAGLLFEDSETAFGVRGAAGARLNARPDLVVRLETSLFWGETQIVEAPFAWLQASISLGYRF